ncbi:hypothetical protein [Kordiimonas aquimaris]|uniref:hypothetical protein n=1 Tax=Kordiimonas aquimaris TaxID=707591 RepID=UPI0021CEBED5|nr:hypothetical protein [Kordiimonas aquimaris]
MKNIITVALASYVMLHPSAKAATAETAVADICNQENVECLTSDVGVIIGRPGTTASYADGIEKAAITFERFFGHKAPKAAVVLGEVVDMDIRRSLTDVYPVVLPWLTIKDREAMVARSVRAQVLRQQPDLEGAALDAVVERSVKASLNANSAGRNAEDMHQGVLAHELGHMFFIRSFWPEETMSMVEVRPSQINRYAGPGPDWLDEMAAVLMENRVLTASRTALLGTMSETDDYSDMWDMETYFSMTHPAFEQARRLIAARQNSAEGRARGGVVILSREDVEAGGDGRNPVTFYAQSRGFADYMIEKTGNERIFADIARYIAAGNSMTEWLAAEGQNYGLSKTVDLLEEDFRLWLKGRYEPADAGSQI